MTTDQAYSNIAQVIEQCIGLGNFKTFDAVALMQQSLMIIKQVIETNNTQSQNNIHQNGKSSETTQTQDNKS